MTPNNITIMLLMIPNQLLNLNDFRWLIFSRVIVMSFEKMFPVTVGSFYLQNCSLPAVIMLCTELQATVKDNVILECSAIGNPQPVITLEKYGGILLSGRYRQIHGNLYLDNMTVEDEGTYMCKANNGLNALQPDGIKIIMLRASKYLSKAV
ncbi:probable oxidoreductase PXDNL [Mya arenaria]|uniref:probable oxidoreductase PXDNL n=1 Tax=Mya arenaria TaxID=6604 RepID=UPI0022E974F3|nr:probable oxidoreductase PXDNL [Mya arenaria]